MILKFAEFFNEMWYSAGKESEDSRRTFKKDPNFGDMRRKPLPPNSGGGLAMGGRMMKKKMKDK
jgi:hypothetical protein